MAKHDCTQQDKISEIELNVNTLTINFETMNDKIDKIEKKIDSIETGINDIKGLISDMRYNYQNEKIQAMEEVKNWVSRHYAGKNVEKLMYGLIIMIISAVMTAILKLVI